MLEATPSTVFTDRMQRARATMRRTGVDVLLVSVGSDLPYLTGYEAMPLERLTMLVLPVDGEATLVVPGLEAPRVTPRPDVFQLVPWGETDDPVALVAGLVLCLLVALSKQGWFSTWMAKRLATSGMVQGYALEGHVPASEIKRLLAEKLNAIGLAVPSMPIGSPGMEGPRNDRYDVFLVLANGHRKVYRHYGVM